MAIHIVYSPKHQPLYCFGLEDLYRVVEEYNGKDVMEAIKSEHNDQIQELKASCADRDVVINDCMKALSQLSDALGKQSGVAGKDKSDAMLRLYHMANDTYMEISAVLTYFKNANI